MTSPWVNQSLKVELSHLFWNLSISREINLGIFKSLNPCFTIIKNTTLEYLYIYLSREKWHPLHGKTKNKRLRNKFSSSPGVPGDLLFSSSTLLVFSEAQQTTQPLSGMPPPPLDCKRVHKSFNAPCLLCLTHSWATPSWPHSAF